MKLTFSSDKETEKDRMEWDPMLQSATIADTIETWQLYLLQIVLLEIKFGVSCINPRLI